MRSMEPTFTEHARRAQIVGCAIETIAEQGYAQASIRKIAERAGVAMSVVLYHFGNKDDLVAAVVSECYRTLLDVMVPAVDAEETATGKLAAHIRTHLRYMGTHHSHQVALMEIANGFRGRDGSRIADLSVSPEFMAALAAVELEVIFQSGIESGEFGPIDVQSMAMAVRGAVGIAVLQSTTAPDFDLTKYGNHLVDAFVRASIPQ